MSVKTSLKFYLASKSSKAVILRRGPSKQVQMISWDRATDQFLAGQWLKGRVYDDRCDLSPKGDYFIYFAGKFRAESYTWTAISRPPFFTALCHWPQDDAWGGGGLFTAKGCVEVMVPDIKAFETLNGPGPNLQIKPYSLKGDIHTERLLRDGWTIDPGDFKHGGRRQKAFMIASSPRVLQQPSPASRKAAKDLKLCLKISKIGEEQGDFYPLDLTLETEAAGTLFKAGRVGDAAWDVKGDLLFSKGGKLFRLPRGRIGEALRKKREVIVDDAQELADFSNNRFTKLEPSSEALEP